MMTNFAPLFCNIRLFSPNEHPPRVASTATFCSAFQVIPPASHPELGFAICKFHVLFIAPIFHKLEPKSADWHLVTNALFEDFGCCDDTNEHATTQTGYISANMFILTAIDLLWTDLTS
jgi:hypothetical protein